MSVIDKYILDKDIVWLISEIIGSFKSTGEGLGLPLGNLTSQLLVNIYMNEFDQYVKHRLKVKHYIRYADDFVFIHQDKDLLVEIMIKVGNFLDESLKLSLHPDKVFIKTFDSGVDFLGWVHFPGRRILRTATKRRMYTRLKENQSMETVGSYIGLIKHGDTYKIKEKVKELLVLATPLAKALISDTMLTDSGK